jgi:membrane protein implicated in regulation of membrane protease activity
MAAALALTPIVWLHYFALLLVIVAIAQPSLGILWFVPLAMVVTPGSGHPTPFQTAWTLGVAAVVVLLSVRTSWVSRPVSERDPFVEARAP